MLVRASPYMGGAWGRGGWSMATLGAGEGSPGEGSASSKTRRAGGRRPQAAQHIPAAPALLRAQVSEL